MASQRTVILDLPPRIAEVNDALVRAGRPAALAELPTLRLLVVGSSDAGKTTLVRALLADSAEQVPALFGRPRPTPVPVEFMTSPGPAVVQQVGGQNGRPAQHRSVARSTADLFGRDVRRVTVRVRGGLLEDWDVTLIDTPGVDAVDGGLWRLSADLLARDLAVLYVVPSRGLAEPDLHALEELRHLPTVVVQNLRDGEVTAGQSSIALVDTPGTACAVSLPIALSRLAADGHERDLLKYAVSLLRTLRMPQEALIALATSCRRQVHELREHYAGRLDAVATAAACGGTEALRAVADLLALQRDGRNLIHLDRTLVTLAEKTKVLPDAREAQTLLLELASAAADRYNVEAGSRAAFRAEAAVVEPSDDSGLGRTFSRHREQLRGFVTELTADAALGLTTADRARLLFIGGQAEADRMELVLVGQFSAGKSSLINAMLSGSDQQESLPARPSPTTATINHLSYASGTEINVDWLEGEALPLELTLLERRDDDLDGGVPSQAGGLRRVHLRSGPVRYRVHVDEIRAVDRWLDAGVVRAQDCHFLLTDEGGGDPSGDGLASFRRLVQDLRVRGNGWVAPFIYTSGQEPKLSSPVFPLSVTVRQFQGRRPELDTSVGLERTLDRISADPAIALRVDKVRIGLNRPLLRHLTVVDTPGTDAPIPRHRICTEAAIKEDGRRAVVYCFSGTKAAGREDERNLEILKSCRIGSDDLSRFFFVITQKGLLQPFEQDQVCDRVRARLRAVGIVPDRLYFTEVVNEHNADVSALAEALNSFGLASKRALLDAWIHDVREVVHEVTVRDGSGLAQLSKDEAQRDVALRALRKELDVVVNLGVDFSRSSRWGIPWARERCQPSKVRRARDVAEDIASLTDRALFQPFQLELDDHLAQLNFQMRTLATQSWDAASSQLQAELSRRTSRREVRLPTLTLPGEVFPSAGVLEASRSCVWRTGWAKFKERWFTGKVPWDADVDRNRQRIQAAWTSSSAEAGKTVDRAMNRAAEATTAQLQRLADGIRAEIEQLSKPVSDDDKRRLEASLSQASGWMVRLDALTRTTGGAGRETR
jgi:GTPase SAR1 family protein